MIRIKRVYEAPSADDGYRVLVDRLWPRGLRREDAALDAWLKEVAPSHALRRWFAGEAATYEEFARRYREELSAPEAAAGLADLRRRSRSGTVTLLYAKSNTTENNAAVLAAHLREG